MSLISGIKQMFGFGKNNDKERTLYDIDDDGKALFREDIINDVFERLQKRKDERSILERQWTLNANFMMGNQFCDINPYRGNEIQQLEPVYDWLEREAFNRISPLIETRIANLKKIKYLMTVKPSTNELDDYEKADVSTAILRHTQAATNFETHGGFGFSSEGEPTPAPGAVQFERFKETARDMYCDIMISIKATKLTGSSGSMADALKTEVEGAYNTAKWNVARSLFGNGSGILTKTTDVAGNIVTVDNTQNIMEGLTIDIFVGTPSAGAIPTVSGRRITAVDRVNKKITIDGAAVTAAAGFITIQRSYNKELTGFGSIFDNSVTNLYGVGKATNPVIKPLDVDADGMIDDLILTRTLREASEYKNSNIDMLLCGNNAYDAYTEYLRTTNQRIEQNYTIVGGFNQFEKYSMIADYISNMNKTVTGLQPEEKRPARNELLNRIRNWNTAYDENDKALIASYDSDSSDVYLITSLPAAKFEYTLNKTNTISH